MTDLLKPETPAAPVVQPASITCEQYVRGEGKRCRHYLPNGACSLPDEFMCVEWLKKNGNPPPPPAKDLFGNPLPDQPTKKPAKPAKPQPPQPAVGDRPVMGVGQDAVPRRGLTTEDIESFKALKVEVCIHSDDCGDLWLVPDYTGQPRKEITPEHLATIARVVDAFPGSRIVAFEKKPSSPECGSGEVTP
jgi:hypothetical protein